MRVTRLGADRDLAQRLERIAAEDLRRVVEAMRQICPECSPASMEVAGGLSAYLGADSPVNGALALGFAEPVTHRDVEAVERFFGERGARGAVSACSLADASLELRLYERGWQSAPGEDVMTMPVPTVLASPSPSAIEARIAQIAEDRALWAEIAANGFAAPDEPSLDDRRLCRAVVARPDAVLLLAFVDRHAAGVGELTMRDGVAWLSTDATLPQFRRRGVQAALQRARLKIAAENDCVLAVSEAFANSDSRRNMLRLGFTHAYSRREWTTPVRVR